MIVEKLSQLFSHKGGNGAIVRESCDINGAVCQQFEVVLCVWLIELVESREHRRLGGKEDHRLTAVDPTNAIFSLERLEEVVESLCGRLLRQIKHKQRIKHCR